MIILRIFLYLICVISIGWSVLVFGGPPIIKRLISGYSDGVFEAIGVTVSPGLDVSISRLEFSFQNGIDGSNIEGFSRATELAWSLFGEKPFLEINLGPSVVKDYATADSLKFYTPSFEKIDWKDISIVAKIESVAVNSFAKIHSVTVDGNLNREFAKLSNVNIRAEAVSATDGNSSYTASLIKSDSIELSFDTNLAEQLLLGIFVIEDIFISEPNFIVPQAIMEVSMTEKARNFKIDFHDVKLSQLNGHINNLKVRGSLTQSNVLQELQLVSSDGFFSKRLPKFQKISASLKRTGPKQYQINIEGRFEEFELSDLDNFIGLLPAGNFVIDLEMDRAIPKVTSISKINFTTLSSTDISGLVEMSFSSELLKNIECAFLDCEFTNFNLFYKINLEDEWIKGSAICLKSTCDFAEMEYLVRTSHTVNVFTILNQANMLNPLSSLYLFGAISAGQKINDGHELKFQF